MNRCLRFALSAALLCGIACHRTPKSEPPPADAKPVATVTAEQILGEYKDNVLAADNKYKDQLIEVKGKFARVGRGLIGDPYVQLGSGSEEEAVGVTCYLTKSAETEAAKLKAGASITMRGVCKGLQGGIALRLFDCEFVK